VFVVSLMVASFSSHAATIVLHNLDAGSGTGFDDPTPVSPVPGNPANTLGGQRLAAFQAAADEWAQTIGSPVPIEVDIEMSSLYCTPTYAVLGSAGPNGIIFRDFPNAPAPGTWYGQALANSIRLFDGNPGTSDIVAEFNQSIGTPGCLDGAGWSYVIDAPPPPGTLAFTETVYHEIAHGLGFMTYTNLGTGSQYQGYPDGYSRFLYDETAGARWPLLSNSQRVASARSGGQLTWDGPAVDSAAGMLTQGRHPSSGRVRMYAPNPFESGSSVTHFSDTLNPADIMTPDMQPGAMRALTVNLMQDIGWSVTPPPPQGISVSLISGDTTEAGGSATFSMVLLSPPASSVSVAVSSNDLSEGTVSPSSVTFTTGNWNTPRFVTVTGVDDALIDGDITYYVTTHPASSSDSNYNGLNPADVSVTNLDDDEAGGINVSGISGDTTESGASATFSIVLDSQPTSSVSIGVNSGDLSEGTVSPSSVTFTTGNWATPKFVTVTGVDDAIVDGDITFSVITNPASSSDPGYNGVNPDNVSVTNLDNDNTGISVSAISGDTTEAGGSASFSVVLNSQPTSGVSFGVSSNDLTEGTVSPSSVNFSTGNWNTPQFVTVTGVDDAIVDGNITFSIITNPVSSGDPNYNGMNPNDVSVTNLDDDGTGISVSGISGNTTEAGGTATFSFVLESQPSSSVSIDVSSNDLSEGTVSPSSVNFSTSNWATPRFVTVTGVDDALADGDITYNITTYPASSGDPNYNGFNPGDVTVTNLDDESMGISVSAISGDTTEAGGTATFSIVLNSQPTNSVAIGVSSNDLSEGTVSPSTVIFSTGNWATPKIVTVTGVDDAVVDGDITFSITTNPAISGDPNYNGINPNDVSVTNLDDDESGGISVSGISGDTTESGGSATFSIVLDSQPASSVSINVSSNDLSEGTISPSNVSFSTGNWGTPQFVTVTGVDDAIVDGDITFNITTHPASSSDPNYNGINPDNVSVTNLDDDNSGITVSAISGDTSEAGGTATFSIVLESQPTNGVSIGVSSTDLSEGTVSPSNVVFATTSWDTPKFVTVTGVDDDMADGDITFDITTNPASSGDANYNGINPSDVSVTNLDDESTGITVSAISGDTTEAGNSATFSIVLESRPNNSVSIGISSDDLSEGTVSQSSVSFSPGNWSTPKIVTVTGVDDDIADGDIIYNITTNPASSGDPDYNGVNPSDVSVTNIDDESSGITVSAISGDITEAGGTATFSIVLDSQPTNGVAIGVSSSDLSEGTVSPSTVVFAGSNWDTPKFVTVTGVDDDIADGDITFSITTNPASSGDPNYNGVNPNDVSVTNLDDESADIIVSLISGDTSESGGDATFTIQLVSEPTDSVTIDLFSDDPGEGTVFPESVTIVPGEWDIPQLVTVTGVDDVIADGDVSYSIVTLSAMSGDGNYDGLDPDDVEVTNVDNDFAGITVSPISGDTSESGDEAVFTIVLESQPQSSVTIELWSDDVSEGIVFPNSVTFTPSQWDLPRTITVTGVDDFEMDGDITYFIVTNPASEADGLYDSIDPPDVSLRNLDNEAPDIMFKTSFE